MHGEGDLERAGDSFLVAIIGEFGEVAGKKVPCTARKGLVFWSHPKRSDLHFTGKRAWRHSIAVKGNELPVRYFLATGSF
jgi:hypothetical protein